ncbi:MAG: RDD family protein [Terracidiphilus sp.]|nr:RDD family protein [Terracidiphilus sp.]
MDLGRDLRSDQLSQDQLSIDTPELVAIEMALAGIGSRFIALLVDYLIWGAGMLLLVLAIIIILPAMHTFNKISAQWAEAIVIFIFFLLNWGYFTLFEAFWNGRTPGKRVAKIRVIQRSGRSIGLLESMARNLVRYVDQLPFFYGVGVIAMFVTRQHQRLGDLAAGTLVVRDREPESPLWGDTGSRTFTAQLYAKAPIPEPHTAVTLPALGISKLSSTDLEVLEGFFSRRLDMSLETRHALGQRIAAAIQAKSGLEAPAGTSVETFLEATARQLRDQARLQ